MRLQNLAFACAITAAAAQDTVQQTMVAKIEGLVDGDAFLMKTRPLTLALELLDAPLRLIGTALGRAQRLLQLRHLAARARRRSCRVRQRGRMLG